MSFQLGKKDIIPGLLAARPRLDSRQADRVLVEHLEHTPQRAGSVVHGFAFGGLRLGKGLGRLLFCLNQMARDHAPRREAPEALTRGARK